MVTEGLGYSDGGGGRSLGGSLVMYSGISISEFNSLELRRNPTSPRGPEPLGVIKAVSMGSGPLPAL